MQANGNDMINLAKYTPIVDTGYDDDDILIHSLGYQPNEYDEIISKHSSNDESYGRKEVVDKIVEQPKRSEFIFTDDLKKQLKINLKDDISPVMGTGINPKPIVNKTPYNGKNEWSKKLSDAYRKAGIKNENAIRMLIAQDALESGWGRSAQGAYNYGNLTTGSKWKGSFVNGNDKDGKGNPIKQKFRSYNSMDEYAVDKVNFLKSLYDFDENDDINIFANKLKGGNRGKRNYAEAPDYVKAIINTYNSLS